MSSTGEGKRAMRLAISFTNLGPYHRARLRALAGALAQSGGQLIVYETAPCEAKYPWRREGSPEPFECITLREGAHLESLTPGECRRAIGTVLERDRPDAVAVAGYVRPECLEALRWAKARGRPIILMSESGAADRPRVWWKEALKARRVRRFDAALVGGPRHRDYLVELGMPAERIALGYNAVDNAAFARRTAEARRLEPIDKPRRPYFLVVARFAPEKNLTRLIRAFGRYRRDADSATSWDLVLCGDGPQAGEVERLIAEYHLESAVHRPGFVQEEELATWHAWAGAFVLPSLSEPWGLVVNEAAAAGLPLLVSERAGCVETLVPQPPGTTGWRVNPTSEDELAAALTRMASCTASQRTAMGRNAERTVAQWGPERFASGMLEALERAQTHVAKRGHSPRRIGRKEVVR